MTKLREVAEQTTTQVFNRTLFLRVESENEEMFRNVIQKIRELTKMKFNVWLDSSKLQEIGEGLKDCKDPESVWRKLVLKKLMKFLKEIEDELSKNMDKEDLEIVEKIFKAMEQEEKVEEKPLRIKNTLVSKLLNFFE
jgi:hypothetical protein